MKRLVAGKRLLICTIVTLCVLLGYAPPVRPQRSPANTSASLQQHRAVLEQYCISCHNQRLKTAGLMLDQLDIADVRSNAEQWEKVVRKLRAGMMPPADAPRPNRSTLDAMSVALETELDRAAASNPNPGRPALHRLNRTEYQNAIRDLLEIDIDAASLLPADDSSHGFDNVAGSLGVSPVLLEGYLSAAAKISRLAVGNPSMSPSQSIYRVPGDLSQNVHIEGLPFGTRGGLRVEHNFPLDGEYSIKLNLMLAPAQTRVGIATGGEQLELNLNGERVRLFSVDEEDDLKGMEVRIPVSAGPQSVGAAFLARNFKSDDIIRPFLKTTFDPTTCIQPGWTCLPHLGTITITGPLTVTGSGDTPSRRRIFSCRPARADLEEACAKEIISGLASRAYRRPVTDEDFETLMGFYETGRKSGSIEQGIETALQRILASPEFVFRIGPEPADVRAGRSYKVSDLELASRLSFFLWSSIPDDELLKLASQRKLRDSSVLESQVRRMLSDPRSDQLINNFGGQWLYLRNLTGVSPSTENFPDFDENLRQAFRQETVMFFESIIREDRSVIDLLSANYTFVNERLARHYGIRDVYGSHFRRITWPESLDARRGLLGHGSILTVTSYPNRTSPVVRGKWILENLLGAPPPDPPPVVPELKEETREDLGRGQAQSVRERLEQHRTNPNCAGCHKIMDPIGFSLENFDGIGRWRTRDETGVAIDASGRLVDGTVVNDPVSLRTALLSYSDQFVRTVSEKLMIYAVGRGLEYYDMPVIRGIVRDAARNNYRFSSIVMGIVKSGPFQMKVKDAGAGSAAAGNN